MDAQLIIFAVVDAAAAVIFVRVVNVVVVIIIAFKVAGPMVF